MRHNSTDPKDGAEKAVRNIRRKTRQHYSAEEKIRIVVVSEEAVRVQLASHVLASPKAMLVTSITRDMMTANDALSHYNAARSIYGIIKKRSSGRSPAITSGVRRQLLAANILSKLTVVVSHKFLCKQ